MTRVRRRSSSLYRSSMFVDFIRRRCSLGSRYTVSVSSTGSSTQSTQSTSLPNPFSWPQRATQTPSASRASRRHAHGPTAVSDPPDTRDQHSVTVCPWHCAENARSTIATARSAALSRSHASIPHDGPRPHTRLPAGHVPSDATGIPSTTPRFPGSPLPPPAPDADPRRPSRGQSAPPGNAPRPPLAPSHTGHPAARTDTPPPPADGLQTPSGTRLASGCV